MNIFKIILIKISLLLSLNSFGVDIIFEKDIPKSREKIYNEIIYSLKQEFKNHKIFHENDINQYYSESEFVFVFGKKFIPIIENNKNFSSKKIILLGEYSVPSDFHSLDNWKMISLFPDPEIFINSIFNKINNLEKIYFVSQKNTNNSWFSDYISNNFKNKVIRYDAINSKEGLKIYRDIFSNINKNEAILMTPDSFFDRIIHTDIIKNAWDKEIHTISVLSTSVKRGFFLSSVNNYDGNKFFMNYLKDFDNKEKITGFSYLSFYYNDRVSKHLGYNRKQLIDNFDLGL